MHPAGNNDPPPKPTPKPGSVMVVQAVNSYTAKSAEELSFEKGDVLYVFDQSNEDWWKARNKNRAGLIPSNHVEVKEVKPLHDAARRGNLTFLEECLEQGVSATSLDTMGNTPLSCASVANQGCCVKSLLNTTDSCVNAQNLLGDTPLHSAAAKNHYGVVEVLLQHGADPTIKNKKGDIPEKLASDPKVKNLLQKYRLSMKKTSSFNPEEYEDSDSD